MLVAVLLPCAFAHPGKTDSNGGHYDRSSGEYHYHHGYSAHHHRDGECPYDFDDKTNHNSSSSSSGDSNYNSVSSSSNSSSSSNTSNNDNTTHKKHTITFGEVVMKIVMFFPFLFMSFCLLGIFNPFVNGTVDISNERTSRILYTTHIILCIIIAIAMTIFIE